MQLTSMSKRRLRRIGCNMLAIECWRYVVAFRIKHHGATIPIPDEG